MIPAYEPTIPFECVMGGCEIMAYGRCHCRASGWKDDGDGHHVRKMEPIEDEL